MKKKEVARFYNRCLLKSMLIDLNSEELLKCFEDNFDSDFDLFLGIVADLIYNEKEFFMLKDSFIFKIICVIGEHSNTADESTRGLINSLFEYFERIINLDIYNKSEMISNYKIAYENAISCSISDSDFFTCIKNDFLLMKLLMHGDVDNIEVNQAVLLSVDYLLYSCPEIFKDKNINTKVIYLLDKFSEKSDILPEMKYNANEIKSDIKELLKRK